MRLASGEIALRFDLLLANLFRDLMLVGDGVLRHPNALLGHRSLLDDRTALR